MAAQNEFPERSVRNPGCALLGQADDEPRTFYLSDIQRGECKWPIGGPPGGDASHQQFCCGPAEAGSPYCREHGLVAFPGRRTAK